MKGVRWIDLREHGPGGQAAPGLQSGSGVRRKAGTPASPGSIPGCQTIPPHADWMCSMCRIGEHDGCMGETKVCFCPICWGNEDDNQTEDRALDGNLTSTPLLW